jgi:hypothetical protein
MPKSAFPLHTAKSAPSSLAAPMSSTEIEHPKRFKWFGQSTFRRDNPKTLNSRHYIEGSVAPTQGCPRPHRTIFDCPHHPSSAVTPISPNRGYARLIAPNRAYEHLKTILNTTIPSAQFAGSAQSSANGGWRRSKPWSQCRLSNLTVT